MKINLNVKDIEDILIQHFKGRFHALEVKSSKVWVDSEDAHIEADVEIIDTRNLAPEPEGF